MTAIHPVTSQWSDPISLWHIGVFPNLLTHFHHKEDISALSSLNKSWYGAVAVTHITRIKKWELSDSLGLISLLLQKAEHLSQELLVSPFPSILPLAPPLTTEKVKIYVMEIMRKGGMELCKILLTKDRIESLRYFQNQPIPPLAQEILCCARVVKECENSGFDILTYSLARLELLQFPQELVAHQLSLFLQNPPPPAAPKNQNESILIVDDRDNSDDGTCEAQVNADWGYDEEMLSLLN